jgi:FKBP-type peptidyl-prolyl cis-trans isomerase 2
MEAAKKGDKVKVEYEGSLEDGTVFDSSEKHEAPLEFTIGSGQLIPGFDEAVIGMKEGEEKEINIPPEKAYGQPKDELIKEVPRNCFPPDKEIKPGMAFNMKMQDGNQILLRISSVKNETVTVDLNPPLAGRTLKFKIKLLSIAS